MSSNPEEEGGKMIPVFTVIKNGVILKNIFVVNKPPSPLSDLSSFRLVDNAESSDQETEEILIAGRHPDCNIVLMHPSISRFHFQINSKPSLRKLFVTDLSSVHGTWVSEKKIDPGFRVELKEGDTIRVGGSTRVYRLHWVPLSRAYDMENPFVSESDLASVEEKEEENVETMSQNEDLLATENKNIEEKKSLAVLGKVEDTNQNVEIQYVDSILEGVVSSFPDENSGLIVKKEIPSAPVMSKDMNSFFHDGIEQMENSSRNDHELSLKFVGGVILQTLSAIFSECNQSPEYHSAEEENTDISMKRVELESHADVSSDSPSSVPEVELAFEVPKETKNQCLLRKDHKQIDFFHRQHVHISRPAGEPSDTNNEYVNKENQTQDDLAALHPLCEEGNQAENQQLNALVNLQNVCGDDHAAAEILEEMENRNPLSKEGILSELTIVCAIPLEIEESMKSSMPLGEVLCESKEIQTPQSDFPETGNSDNIMSPEYHSAEEENTDISMTRVEQESHVDVSPDSPSSVTELDSAFKLPQEPRSQSLLSKDNKQTDTFPLQSVHLSMPAGEPSETNNEHIEKDKQIRDVLYPLCAEGNQENSTENQQLNELVDLQNICSHDLTAAEILEEIESQSPLRKEGIVNEFRIVSAVPFEKEESVNSSMPPAEVLSMSKESQSPQYEFPATGNLGNIMGSPIRSEKKSGLCNIWSRRGKPATALQLQSSKSRRKTRREEKNDGDAEGENCKDDESKSISRALFDLDAKDEEIFTPDKENCTPNTSILRSLKKGRLEDIQLSKSGSKIPFSPKTRLEDDMIGSSDKENQTPRFLRDRKSAGSLRHRFKLEEDIVPKERRAGRVPLQTLISNSPLRSLSEASIPSAAVRSSSSISCNQNKVTNSTSINSVGDGRRRWTMIADTMSLLDKETRKVLQLLQGLKRTHLIIPRMVIRELDSLKQGGSLFRRTTEASMALQWIEECLVKTKWWIHVQSSVEEVMPIAPTPPASPVSRFSEGSELLPYWKRISASFSTLGSPLEIVSPTAEDHILDCALSYRKMNDGQFVLLSNDVTLKIKAMAEGLICETAQEFRDSLVNPFSERFLWAESSPRGQTWSVFDDVVLKENYYRNPSKKSSREEGAKGLKLILLHNSHYGQTTPFVKTM